MFVSERPRERRGEREREREQKTERTRERARARETDEGRDLARAESHKNRRCNSIGFRVEESYATDSDSDCAEKAAFADVC